MPTSILQVEADETYGYLYTDNVETAVNGHQVMYIFDDSGAGNTQTTIIKFDYNPKPDLSGLAL
ncbi:hypothetical protein D3C84_993990 [compost metagenome]